MSVHMLKLTEEDRVCVMELWSVVLGLCYEYKESDQLLKQLDNADGIITCHYRSMV